MSVAVLLALVLSQTPPPAQDAPNAARDRLPFESFRFEPWSATPPPEKEDRSVLVERVARITYLGGGGVAGPGALLGTVVNLLVEPALGAIASTLSSDDGAQSSGSITRSTAAAYGKTLSYMGTFVALWLVGVPLWIALIGVVPALVALGTAAVTGFTPQGLQAGVGAGAALALVGVAGLLVCAGIPWFAGRTVGHLVGEGLFDRLTGDKSNEERAKENQGDLEKLLRETKLGPLPSIRAGVLLAAVTGGTMERYMRWDGLVVIGPFITAAKAASELPTALQDARDVAELGPLGDGIATRVRALVFARSTLLAFSQALIITGALVASLAGVGLLATAFVPGLGLTIGLPVAAGALMAGAGLALFDMACGAVAFLSNALLPWAVVLLAGTPAEGSPAAAQTPPPG